MMNGPPLSKPRYLSLFRHKDVVRHTMIGQICFVFSVLVQISLRRSGFEGLRRIGGERADVVHRGLFVGGWGEGAGC